MKKETVPYLKKTFFILMAFWTFAIGLFLTLSIIEEKNTVFSIAAKECKTGFVKDVQYRLWATKHGGVYVPQSEDTPPNPYLSHIPERDITTPSGKKLTLMNPAYMTRQVFEISKERFGYKGHITSLNPLRKENSADDWEKKSLTSFEHGVNEVLEIVDLNGEPHIRFMSPFITEKGCLKCHASQGYKVGEIRGGISISLPWKPFNKMFWSQMQGNLIRYIGIWLIGICGLVFAYKKMKINISDKERLNEEVKNNERMLDSLLNGIKESALLIDVNGKVLAANNTVDDRINSGKRDIVGKNVFDLLNSDEAESRRRYIEEVIRVRKALQFEDVRNGRVINNSLSPVLESNGTVSKIALIGFDITTQRENEKALKESENKFRALIEDSIDVITLIDATGIILYESPSYQKVMGYSVNERIGKNAFVQLHPDDRENILGLFKEVLLSTNWITLPPTRVLNADGTYHWIEGTVNNKISDPNIGGIIINYRDITELRLANIELEQHRNNLEELIQTRTKELDAANLKLVREVKLKEEAEEQLKELLIKEKELSNLKSRFISTASHEFRTPLASLSSSTELIQRYKNKWDDNKINEHLNRIMNSAAHLTKLMDDVISINRAETGKIVFAPEECNLYEICKNVIEYLNLDTNENIKFHFSFEASKRHYILDEKQIKLVLNNLLSNAVKYSNNDSTANLLIYCDESKLVIKISDEGIGIPEEDLPRLFAPFYRASNTSNIKGSGLGLSIVKHAVDLHGGTIQVNSKQGVGTTFTITLPITM